MNFEQFSLDRRIVAAIKTVGYTTPTPIQQQATPIVLKGHDVLGLAQTGTGKTAAFLLPILHQPTQGPLHQVHARIVVACPGRLLDLLSDGSINLSRVKTLVLDEADLGSWQNDVLSREFYAN